LLNAIPYAFVARKKKNVLAKHFYHKNDIQAVIGNACKKSFCGLTLVNPEVGKRSIMAIVNCFLFTA